jgi:UDP-glucose 4-epimerase
VTRKSFETGSPSVPDWVEDSSGRRLAILGADGFIGSHVARIALASGADVTAVCVKEPWRLQDVGDASGLTIVAGAARNWWEAGFQPTLAELLGGADALALLAYEPPRTTMESERSEHELEVNAAGTRRVAETAFAAGLRVVFASSADVYGPEHRQRVSERTPPRPVSPYGRAKLAAERLLAEAARGSNTLLALRIATVYGPGENGPRAIPAFVRAFLASRRPVVHGDGTDVRDYVHVQDVAAAIVNASVLDHGETIVNLGSGVGRTTNDVLAAVADVMGIAARASYEPSARPPSRLVLETTRASRLLGFRPRSDFEDALLEEVAWLRDHLSGELRSGAASR